MEAYDHQALDASAKEIVDHAKRTNARVAGPIPLPTRIDSPGAEVVEDRPAGNTALADKLLGLGIRRASQILDLARGGQCRSGAGTVLESGDLDIIPVISTAMAGPVQEVHVSAATRLRVERSGELIPRAPGVSAVRREIAPTALPFAPAQTLMATAYGAGRVRGVPNHRVFASAARLATAPCCVHPPEIRCGRTGVGADAGRSWA